MKSFRTAFTSPIFLKVSSLILGFLLWSSVSELFPRTLWVAVPISFYNKDLRAISAPESVHIELSGKRSHIKRIDTHNLAVHIDAQTLHTGDNHLAITHEQLLMPPSITVATIIPQKVVVQVTQVPPVRKGEAS